MSRHWLVAVIAAGLAVIAVPAAGAGSDLVFLSLIHI